MIMKTLYCAPCNIDTCPSKNERKTLHTNNIIYIIYNSQKGILVFLLHSTEMAEIYQKASTQVKELIKICLQHSRASVYRYARKKLSSEQQQNCKCFNKGRPPSVSVRDHQKLLRSLTKLQDNEGVFTYGRMAKHAGVLENLSRRAVRRVPNKEGYFYLQAHKKGLLLR